MNEDQFFMNIAQRLGRKSPLTTVPIRTDIGAPGFWRKYHLPLEKRTDLFRNELGKLGGHCEVFSNVDSLRDGIHRLLSELHPETIGSWKAVLDEYRLEDVLGSYEVICWDESQEEQNRRSDMIGKFAGIDVGITGVDYAIANTATSVIACSPDKGRSTSLLPTVHIVIIKSSQLLTRMGEVLQEITSPTANLAEKSSSINFISGPSRSSDIENDLSIGVHGPVAFYALILKDETDD